MSYRAKKRRAIGPMVIVPMNGSYRVIDKGDGSIVIPVKFKSRDAAERWIARRPHSSALIPGT